MNLLQSELIEHQKVLDAFKDLPADLKRLILTFYKSSNGMICPECFAAPYKILILEGGIFICSHNQFKLSNWLTK